MNRRSALTIPLVLAFAFSATWVEDAWSQPDLVTSELISEMPTEDVLFEFGVFDYSDGWGWIRLPDEWRDVGMSFTAPTDASFDRITLRIQRVPNVIPAGTEFTLKVYETSALGEVPDLGALVFEGTGTLDLAPGDQNLFLLLTLAHEVPVSSGMIYTFLLSFSTEDPANHIIFENNTGYQNGQSWFRSSETDGELKALNQSDNPGLVFAIQ